MEQKNRILIILAGLFSIILFPLIIFFPKTKEENNEINNLENSELNEKIIENKKLKADNFTLKRKIKEAELNARKNSSRKPRTIKQSAKKEGQTIEGISDNESDDTESDELE